MVPVGGPVPVVNSSTAVRPRTANSTAPTSKIPNVYGPQDDRTAKMTVVPPTRRSPGGPVASWSRSPSSRGPYFTISDFSTSVFLPWYGLEMALGWLWDTLWDGQYRQ